MAYGPYSNIDALAAAIAADLCGGSEPAISGNAADAAAVIARAVEKNFNAAAEIDREVEAQMKQLGAQTVGMDIQKLRAGLRARIAKQRGFAL